MRIRQMVNDRVLLKPIEPDERTGAGIYLPDVARGGRFRRAEVLAVGPGRRNADGERLPVTVEAGQRVILSQGRVLQEIEIDDEDLWVARESDLLAVEDASELSESSGV